MVLLREVQAAIAQIISERIALLKDMVEQQNDESVMIAATQVAICGTPEAVDALCDLIEHAPNEQYREILMSALFVFAPQKNRASLRTRLEEMFKGDPVELATIKEGFDEMEEDLNPEILALDSIMNDLFARLQCVATGPGD